MAPLLQVTDLQTHYVSFGGERVIKAVDGVSFTLEEGETLGLVGESGCGKTTTCQSIVNLLPAAARIVGGSISFMGQELTTMRPREMRHIRGAQIAMILQDPMASLNPLFSIYRQVMEPAYYHRAMRGGALRERVRELLNAVRIPSPAMRMREYPHQMSGGMRQRIVGAIALAGGPKLIIADEPTTNLDVTIQAQYLDLLRELQEQTGVAIIFVTHNLGIVARMCDKLAVMYAGKIVEAGSVRQLFNGGRHPYTKALLRLDAEARQQGKAARDPGTAARPRDLAAGLRFPSALSRSAAAVFGEAAARDADRRILVGAVLARRTRRTRIRTPILDGLPRGPPRGPPCRSRCWKLTA